MAIEIEAKFRLADPQRMRSKLADLGARRLGEVLEDNTYFDTPDGALRRADCGLRIRTARAPDGQTTIVLTHKGPRRPGEMKVRAETEVGLSSAADAAALLAALGYQPALSFQKRRESFELAGARVELDELPEMGFFIEIEAADEPAVDRVREKLGLAGEPIITSTYIDLADHLAAAGPPRAELRFGPPAGPPGRPP